MIGYISLSPEARQNPPSVGDIIGVEILLEAKVGSPGDAWKIKTPNDEKWIATGSLTLSTKSVRAIESEGSTTKLIAEALVHQPGPLTSTEFTVVHVSGNQEILVGAAELAKEVAAPTASEEAKPQWTLPPVAFGGWNYFVIALLAVLLFTAIFLLGKKFGQRLKLKRKLNHRDAAIQALHPLQKFARSKKILQQEEWKKFSFDLARIIRTYSDENFKIDSRDMTDREFLTELRFNSKAKPLVENLSAVLSTIDEVRYGKKALDATVVPGLLLETRKFFEQSYQSEESEGKK